MAESATSTADLVTKRKKKSLHPVNLLDHTIEHLTTVSFCTSFLVNAYLLYLCFKLPKGDWDKTTYHVCFYTIGWMLLMTETVHMVTKNNVFVARLALQCRTYLHGFVGCVSIILSTTAFFYMVKSKNEAHRDHFISDHAYYGMIAQVMLIPTCINGILAFLNRPLQKIVSPRINKIFHALTGLLTFCFGGVAMITSYDTFFFKRFSENNNVIYWTCYYSTVFTLILAGLPALITMGRRVLSFF